MTNTQKNLTTEEAALMAHVSMWGSDAYPVRKCGSKWMVGSMFGCGGFSTMFKTKREATERFELFYGLLRDKKAGRI